MFFNPPPQRNPEHFSAGFLCVHNNMNMPSFTSLPVIFPSVPEEQPTQHWPLQQRYFFRLSSSAWSWAVFIQWTLGQKIPSPVVTKATTKSAGAPPGSTLSTISKVVDVVVGKYRRSLNIPTISLVWISAGYTA
jgi:hypothetical protein